MNDKKSYSIICPFCDRKATVPFKPAKNKPAPLCHDCFELKNLGCITCIC